MPKRPSSPLGSYIRQLREDRAWTQEHLAALTNLSVTTISRIERGFLPEFETLAELAAAFEVPVEELTRRARQSREGEPAAPQSAIPPRPHGTAASGSAGTQFGEIARARRWAAEHVQSADRIQAAIALHELTTAVARLNELAGCLADPFVDLVRAEVAYQIGDYEGAECRAREAVDHDPGLLDAWLLGFRASIAGRNTPGARKWLTALLRLFPRHPSTLRAQAQLAWEEGEIGTLRAALAQLSNEAVFARDSDNDLRRLLDAASIVVGDGKVNVLLAIFQGQGIRTAFIGWRDQHSVLPEPTITTRWRPIDQAAREALKIEPIETADSLAIKGIRVTGMEDPPEGGALRLVGMLEVSADFGDLRGTPDDAYGGLFLIDHARKLVHQPRRLWARAIRGIPSDDWLDPPRSSGAASPAAPGPAGAGTPTIFVTYAREDLAQVEWLHRALREHGLQIGWDHKLLISGDPWADRIDDSIRTSDFVVYCLSRTALTKRGHVQVELRRILAEAERRPLGAAYVIPVRLEDVDVPRVLAHIHYIDLFPDRQQGADRIAQHILAHWRGK